VRDLRLPARHYCAAAYWAGGALLVAASALNPFGPSLILTSGAATGFGAMAGLVLIPLLLTGARQARVRPAERVRLGSRWVLGGAIASIAFVLVLGPGVQLGPADVPTSQDRKGTRP
jgi:hypothetical protein